MRPRAYFLALVFALGAAIPVSAQRDDVSPASREVRQLLAAAQEQIAAGDFEAAGATIDSISTLGPVSQQELSFILYLRGQVFYELGQPDRAVAAWRQALSIGGLPEAQAQALETTLARLAERAVPAQTPSSPRELLQAADQAARFGRADEAATYYEAAIEGFTAQGDATGLARAHYGLGNHLAMTRRDLEGALEQYAIAVEQAELAGEASLLRSALGVMGGAAIAADRPGDGRAAFARLLGLLGDNEAAPRAAALFGIGEASLRLKDWPAAAEAYEQWLAVMDAAENPDASPQMLHSYALSLRLAGRTNDALAIIARLEAIAESDDERRRLALQLEQDSARARGLGNVAASCWFDARAHERYVALGREEDADALKAILEGCSEAPID